MKVIFLEDVPEVARAGDVRDVKNGYGRNHLFPKKLAVLATTDQLRRVQSLRKGAALQQEVSEERALELKDVLDGVTVTITARTGPTGRLYGSVSAAIVAREISKTTGHKIASGEIVLHEPIKSLGSHQIPIRLTPEISPTIVVDVVEEVMEEKPAPTRRKTRSKSTKDEADITKQDNLHESIDDENIVDSEINSDGRSDSIHESETSKPVESTVNEEGSIQVSAEKEIMQTEPVQVIVLILAGAPKTTPGTLPICPLVEIPKGFSGP